MSDEMNAALRVAIVGGGITGLSAAYYLERDAVCCSRPRTAWAARCRPSG